MENLVLLNSLERILGPSHKKSRDNYAFHCPFCNHYKPKLEINLLTSNRGENPFACWVCGTKGKTIRSLLTQLKIPLDTANNILEYVKNEVSRELDVSIHLGLPKEFKPLYEGFTIEFNRVKKYLYTRGLTDEDFIKYNIGYCSSGAYANRVIIPSYDSNNILNFFIGRLAGNMQGVSYKNPAVNKDIVFFENMVNWKTPVILCEGVFDAMAIKRNAIPILGKVVSKKLYERLAHGETKDVYVALDKDALKGALLIADKLLALGKRVFLVNLEEKDPSLMGFKSFTELISQAKPLTFEEILTYKLTT